MPSPLSETRSWIIPRSREKSSIANGCSRALIRNAPTNDTCRCRFSNRRSTVSSLRTRKHAHGGGDWTKSYRWPLSPLWPTLCHRALSYIVVRRGILAQMIARRSSSPSPPSSYGSDKCPHDLRAYGKSHRQSGRDEPSLRWVVSGVESHRAAVRAHPLVSFPVEGATI